MRSGATIRASIASEDMSLSARERAEGFLPLSSTEPTSSHSERAEGFPASTVAVATSLQSERSEGFLACYPNKRVLKREAKGQLRQEVLAARRRIIFVNADHDRAPRPGRDGRASR